MEPINLKDEKQVNLRQRNNLRKLLKDKKMSYRQTTKEINVDDGNFTRIINGDRKFPEHILLRLSDYFNVSTDFLLDKDLRSNMTFKQKKIVEIVKRLNESDIDLLLTTLEKMNFYV